jgi:hypothetical protein
MWAYFLEFVGILAHLEAHIQEFLEYVLLGHISLQGSTPERTNKSK